MSGKWVTKKVILDEKAVDKAILKLARSIVERNGGIDGLALVGIRRGGVFLAKRLKEKLEDMGEQQIPFGLLDISLYRDDVFLSMPNPVVGTTEIGFSVEEYNLILVDDVLYTGRTVRAALDAVMDYGRPQAVWLTVLVDRGYRELPIAADFIGWKESTKPEEMVEVFLGDNSKDNCAVLQEWIDDNKE